MRCFKGINCSDKSVSLTTILTKVKAQNGSLIENSLLTFTSINFKYVTAIANAPVTRPYFRQRTPTYGDTWG